MASRQLLKSARMLYTNYRDSLHAESDNDFVSKIEQILQEAQAISHSLELLCELQAAPPEQTAILIRELNELTSTFAILRQKVEQRTQNI